MWLQVWLQNCIESTPYAILYCGEGEPGVDFENADNG